jgi:hypothetical protein
MSYADVQMMHSPHLIKNAGTMKASSEHSLMDGIIRGSLNTFQQKAESGIITNAMMKQHASNKPDLVKSKGKPTKTKLRDGFTPYPGSSKAMS